jgi:hypothetical protein
LRDVCLDRYGLHALGPDLVGHGLGSGGCSHIVYGYVGALVGKSEGNCGADAAAGARDWGG